MGLGSDAELLKMFDNHPIIQKTIEKDFTKSEDEALIEMSKRLRPGEVFNLKAIKKNLEKMTHIIDAVRISTLSLDKIQDINQNLSEIISNTTKPAGKNSTFLVIILPTKNDKATTTSIIASKINIFLDISFFFEKP